MEIERKFLIEKLPKDLGQYPVWCLEQAYLCREPVIRVRKEEYKEKKEFILTYKSDGLMEREEYNLPLTQESYLHLKAKADGKVITKKRYRIPEKSSLMNWIFLKAIWKGLLWQKSNFQIRRQQMPIGRQNGLGKR